MFPSIVECRVELDFTSTRRVFQPWMSPSTRTPRAFRVELLESLMLPFTFVWTNVHVAPVGTWMLPSTVVLPMVPRQVRSRSEEHTSELQSLMRISYAVFCLKK